MICLCSRGKQTHQYQRMKPVSRPRKMPTKMGMMTETAPASEHVRLREHRRQRGMKEGHCAHPLFNTRDERGFRV
jgi:hypothetical protein